jgi:acetoin utilization protein AcuB
MEAIFNSKLIGIRTGTSVSEAKQMMKEKRIRHLPVVDANNKIVAMLSARDLSDVAKFQDMPVDLFSSFPVKFVTLDVPLSKVALMMIEEKISSVLVCDETHKAVGIITSDDLLFQFSQMLKEKEKSIASESTPLSALTTAGEFFRRLSEIGI